MKKHLVLLFSLLLALTLVGCSTKDKEIKEIHVTNLPSYATLKEDGTYYLCDEEGNQVHFEVTEQDSEKYDIVTGACGPNDDGDYFFLVLLSPKEGYQFVDGFTISEESCSSLVLTDDTEISTTIAEDEADYVQENYCLTGAKGGDVALIWPITRIEK